MLVVHPSSCCDVCASAFGPDLECHSIPCGHVFCRPCIDRLPYNRIVCPLCRAPLNSRARARRIVVDWGLVNERDLEAQLAQEAERGIDLRRAMELQQKIQDFVKNRPQEEHTVLKSFASVLCALYQSKDELADMKKHYEQLTQREGDLQRDYRLAMDHNAIRNEPLIEHLLKTVKGFERAIKELRGPGQELSGLSLPSMGRSQSLSLGSQLPEIEANAGESLQDIPFSLVSHLPSPPHHPRSWPPSPLSEDSTESHLPGPPALNAEPYPVIPALPVCPPLVPRKSRSHKDRVRFTVSSDLHPEPLDRREEHDHQYLNNLNRNVSRGFTNTIPHASVTLPSTSTAPSGTGNMDIENDARPRYNPEARIPYFPITHSMPRPVAALHHRDHDAHRSQATLQAVYHPLPPMPTVRVPEIGVDDVWPYVATPRLREILRKNTEYRAAKARAPPHPSLSYETVYREHLQSRVAGNVPLPGDIQPQNAFPDNRAGNIHNPHTRTRA